MAASEKQLKHLEKIKGKGGRARKGKKSEKTLQLEAAHRETKQLIAGMAKQLVMAASIDAFGAYKIMRKDEVYNKHGKIISVKWTHVDDGTEIENVLNSLEDVDERGVVDDKYYIIVKDKPNYKAAEALLARSFGRPKESVEIGGPDGAPILINFRK